MGVGRGVGGWGHLVFRLNSFTHRASPRRRVWQVATAVVVAVVVAATADDGRRRCDRAGRLRAGEAGSRRRPGERPRSGMARRPWSRHRRARRRGRRRARRPEASGWPHGDARRRDRGGVRRARRGAATWGRASAGDRSLHRAIEGRAWSPRRRRERFAWCHRHPHRRRAVEPRAAPSGPATQRGGAARCAEDREHAR
jgi:hypothetical protein